MYTMMNFDPIWALSFNGGAQVLVSSLLGTFMLIPMQPWGKGLLKHLNMKSLLATHLDWYMLAFMQWGAAFLMWRWPLLQDPMLAALLMFGGWANPLPYLLRGFGINAFVMGGGWLQRGFASLAGLSVAAILWVWAALLWRLWGAAG
ncbi:MAG: hypothetical protein RI907_1124 [Pseudomonadota bacterium]|jgi:hypothetical protein